MVGQTIAQRFVDRRCVLGAGELVPKDDLYRAYADWHRTTGQPGRPLARNALCRALLSLHDLSTVRGPHPDRTRYFVGVGLKLGE